MATTEEKAREEVMWAVKQVTDKGYVLATGGNFSSRVEGQDKFIITPSSRPYDTMKKEDLCVVGMDGKVLEGEFKPSTETPFHNFIYVKRPDVKAIVHMHSRYALCVASLEGCEGVPVFSFEMRGYFGGAIPMTPFKRPGSQELAEVIIEGLGEKGYGVLMENHGATVVGMDMKQAVLKADLLERACEQYLIICAAGKIHCL